MRKLIICCASGLDCLVWENPRLGVLERRGSQKGGFSKRNGLEKKGSWKEVVKILAGIQNLEVGVDPGSQRAAWGCAGTLASHA